MKVLHIIPSYKPAYVYGGPIFSVSSLCETIAREQHEVTVFTSTANGKEDLPVATETPENVDGVKVFYFPRWTKGNSNFTPGLLLRLFREIKNYDAVHIHSWWNLIVIPAAFIAILRGVQPIISVRGTMSTYTFTQTGGSKIKLLFHRLIGKHLLRRSLIHVTSAKEMKECQKYIGDFSGYILPNFIEVASPEEIKMPPAEKPFRMITISRIHPVKNLEMVFRIMADLKIPCELHILGKGEETYVAQLKTLSEELNISKHIHWHGHQNKKEKYQLLNQSHLFIQLSFTENFGNAVIEAASTGIPVLVTETTGAAEYVEKLDLGWVVPLEEKLIGKILQGIIGNSEKRASIKKHAPALVKWHFSGSPLAQKYVKEYGGEQKPVLAKTKDSAF